jgi:tRNA(Ile)-lysidine synthetase-like protein
MDRASLLSSLSKHLSDSRLLDGARHVVVACSGGGDSTALLLLLSSLSKQGSPSSSSLPSLDLVACHVAHGLRGKAGDEDALFVANLTESLGIPLAVRPVKVLSHRKKGESLEAAARRLRYDALFKLKEELGEGTLVATGHTRDDQAETVLLNLSRRSGRSRGGIRPKRADGVVRPLLPFSREELRTFLEERGIPWREDETNENESFERNRIRRKVLPALEAKAPGAAQRLAKAAEAWSNRLDELDRRIDAALRSQGLPLEGPWPRRLFEGLGREASGRLLIRAAGRSGRVPGRKQVELILSRLFGANRPFGEILAGHRFEADSRIARLSPPKKSPGGPPDRLKR